MLPFQPGRAHAEPSRRGPALGIRRAPTAEPRLVRDRSSTQERHRGATPSTASALGRSRRAKRDSSTRRRPPAFRAARAWSQKPHATVAAHESAAEEPVPQPFQPRGAQAVLRAFLGTSPRTRRTLRMKKNRIPGVDFFHASLVARLAGVLPTNLTRFPGGPLSAAQGRPT